MDLTFNFLTDENQLMFQISDIQHWKRELTVSHVCCFTPMLFDWEFCSKSIRNLGYQTKHFKDFQRVAANACILWATLDAPLSYSLQTDGKQKQGFWPCAQSLHQDSTLHTVGLWLEGNHKSCAQIGVAWAALSIEPACSAGLDMQDLGIKQNCIYCFIKHDTVKRFRWRKLDLCLLFKYTFQTCIGQFVQIPTVVSRTVNQIRVAGPSLISVWNSPPYIVYEFNSVQKCV